MRKWGLGVLLLDLLLRLAYTQDFRDGAGGFDFIYHEYANLLLTIHDDTCYFSFIPDDVKNIMHTERRKYIEGNGANSIAINDTSQIFVTTLDEMRDSYADRLANFHCLDKDIYTLQLFASAEQVTCDFESNQEPMCGFTQDQTDQFDWTRHNGPTPTLNTGPMNDHTMGSNGTGHYVYTESSEPRYENDTARFISAVFSSHAGRSSCLRFSYNMHGDKVGTLNVYSVPAGWLGDGYAVPSHIWRRTGEQGQDWMDAEIELHESVEEFQIVFEGIIGQSYLNDIAIDDISVSRDPCNPPVSCNFESWTDPTCGFVNDSTGDFTWTLGSGPTSTDNTGPTEDHSFGVHGIVLGHYMYIESSEPRMPNDTARLVKEIRATASGSSRCLRFFYHMYGRGTGTLSVHVRNRNFPAGFAPSLLILSGDQGNEWKQAEITVPIKTEFELVFEAVIGQAHMQYGDIAVDDLEISEGACKDTVNPANTTTGAPVTTEVPYVLETTESTALEPTTTTTTTSERPTSTHAGPVSPCEVDLLALFKCCFEDDEYNGGWCDIRRGTQGSNGNYWTRHQGATPTDYTGPAFDHSLGPNQHGHYLYIQSSGHYNVWTNLHTPRFDAQRDTRYCLKFHFHMYGHDINELHVHIDTITNTPVWSKSGNQGNAWKEAVLDFTHNGPFEIIFEGHTGRGPQGDAAIDDVFLYHGPCSSVPH